MKKIKEGSSRGRRLYFLLVILILMLLGSSTFVTAESTCIKKGDTYFVLMHIPGKNFAAKATDPKLKEEYKQHQAFMGELGAKGQALIGGPFKWKEGGGLAVLTVKTMEEARAIAEKDPALKSGIYKYKIYPWMPVTVSKDCE